MSSVSKLKTEKVFSILDERQFDTPVEENKFPIDLAYIDVMKHLPRHTDRIYMLLCDFAFRFDARTGIPKQMTLGEVAEETLISVKRAKLVLSDLEKAGLIRIDRQEDASVTITVQPSEAWTIRKDAASHE